jgi:hypothetical protein
MARRPAPDLLSAGGCKPGLQRSTPRQPDAQQRAGSRGRVGMARRLALDASRPAAVNRVYKDQLGRHPGVQQRTERKPGRGGSQAGPRPLPAGGCKPGLQRSTRVVAGRAAMSRGRGRLRSLLGRACKPGLQRSTPAVPGRAATSQGGSRRGMARGPVPGLFSAGRCKPGLQRSTWAAPWARSDERAEAGSVGPADRLRLLPGRWL